MEHEIEEQIKTLALSLKGMHLSATMEEALARAREIILQSRGTSDQPLKQVIQKEELRVQQGIEQDMHDVQKIDVTLDHVKDALSQGKEEQQSNNEELKIVVKTETAHVQDDKSAHAREQNDFEIVKGDLTRKKQAFDDIKEFVEMAKEVQK